ncbi:hypothetical protein EVAR_22449_1 [Eumeta japonica]|uniref:Histone-lysine N-methyltransferase SETMAR n=1 Tax=Eumeta variegata TaxID=151549 RepID=A0A4C1VDH1_EUMVA|nr:hypothetical protein EVAR_22449_1 [Eumeta japonica]
MSSGILLWRQAADVHRIFVLQKRAIRAIYGLESRVSLRSMEVLVHPPHSPELAPCDFYLFHKKNYEESGLRVPRKQWLHMKKPLK